MTEKRFTEIVSTQKVIDNQTNKEYNCLIDNELLELLNELHEENEQLKQQLTDCEKFRHTVFQEISKEMSKHD